jgi:hypothetical protein
MAIDKRTFKGGMNKDVDQRLIPNDQYRDAINVQNLHGADGTMGVITPIPGNIKKATGFSFTNSEAQGGKLTINIDRIVFNWGGSNSLKYILNYNLTNGTTVIEHTATHNLLYSGYIALLNEYPIPSSLSAAEIDNLIFSNHVYNNVLQDISNTTALQNKISVEIVNSVITITATEANYNFSGLFYRDNYTTPAAAYDHANDVFVSSGGRQVAESIENAIEFDAVCVGSATDEVKRIIYYFVTQTKGLDRRDWILRFSELSNSISIVYSEYKDLPSAVLKFNSYTKIHNADVIDSKFLAWTDGNSTPKRINIAKCLAGYTIYKNNAKPFYDNHSATWSSPEFVDVNFEGNSNGLQDKLTFVSEEDFGIAAGSIIYVEQQKGFLYNEYNNYFKVTHVSSDGKRLVVDHEFIGSSPAAPGKIWEIISYDSASETFSYVINPQTAYYPEAYNNIYKHIKEQYVNAHKRGPRDKATYSYFSDTAKKKNNLFGHVWQFAYRYVYDDNDVSALSPISDIRIPATMALNSTTGVSYTQSYHNGVDIIIPFLNDGIESLQTLNTDTEYVDGTVGRLHTPNTGLVERLYALPSNIMGVEIYAREGNESPFMLIDTVNWYTNKCVEPYKEAKVSIRETEQVWVGDNLVDVPGAAFTVPNPLVFNPKPELFLPFQNLKVTFYNDGIYTVLDSRNADKLYDWVPHTAEAQSIIDNSSIIYGNVTDGFDLACQLDVSMETEYRSNDDANYSIVPVNAAVSTGPQFQVYVIAELTADNGGGNWDSGDDFFGTPNAVSNDSQLEIGANLPGTFDAAQQYDLSTPCPGLANGHALVSWPGVNHSNGWGNNNFEAEFNRSRCIIQLDVSDCPVETSGSNQGFVPIGTQFSSSGSFHWAYKYGSFNNKENRYGIGNDWEHISVSCNVLGKTVTAFCNEIATAFKSISNKNVNNSSGDYLNVTNWRTCKVFDNGTFYAPTAVGDKAGQMIYIYFTATGPEVHDWGALVKPKFYKFNFSHSSGFTDLKDTVNTFKSGAHHDFGIIYGNNRNQTSYVNKSKDTTSYVKFSSERLASDAANSGALDSAQTNTLGLPVIKWAINHAPPAWAEWYQWVYAGNTTVKDFLQFTSERVAKNLEDSGDKKVYLNLNSFKGKPYSYKSNDNPLIDYVFGEGDRIRFISNKAGSINTYIDVPVQDAKVYPYHTQESDIDSALTNPLREFYEQKFSGSTSGAVNNRKKFMEGYWISFNAPEEAGFTYDDVTILSEGAYEEVLFEIYNPKKNLQDGPSYYYGLSDKLAIEKHNVTGDKYHTAGENGVDQSVGTTPVAASGYLYNGDVYVKGRRMVAARLDDVVVVHKGLPVEGYFVNDFIKSDTYNKGRKHTYNQYVKEETRTSTVYYSGPYLSTSNVNGLSEFNIIDIPLKEYSIGYGPIEKMVEQDSNLILFQKNKVSRVMVKKALLMGATGDSNVALSDQVLSVASPYAGEYGPAYAGESVIKHANKIYFVDPLRGVMCRLSGDGITVISQNGMHRYFLDYFRNRKSFLGAGAETEGGKGYRYSHSAGFNPESNEYIYFGEYIDENTSFDSTSNKVLGFYEDLNKYVSFYSYRPEELTHLGSNFYTFKGGYIYLHNQDTTKANSNKFYGASVSDASSIDVVFNGAPSMVKTFNNVSIEGTYPWTPSSFKTENFIGEFKTNSGGLNAPNGAHYWVRKEGVYHMPIPLGDKTEFKDYNEKVSLKFEGLTNVVYTNATTLTCSSDVSSNIVTGANYAVFDGANPSVPIDCTITVINGTVLTVTGLPGSGTFVAGNTYFLVRKLSLCPGLEGSKAKGVFSNCSFSIVPSSFTFNQNNDQDTIELFAINVDMDYSPLSYKNN